VITNHFADDGDFLLYGGIGFRLVRTVN